LVEIAPTAAVLALSRKATLVLAEHFGVKATFTNILATAVCAVPVPVVQSVAAQVADEATHSATTKIVFFILYIPLKGYKRARA
jgi:hypothetical protein